MALDRRVFLFSAVAGGAVAPWPGLFAQAPASAPKSALDALLDQFMQERLALYPEEATEYGLDVGELAGARHRLDPNSATAIAARKQQQADQIRRLLAIDRRPLSGLDAVNYDAVLYGLETKSAANRAFSYGEVDAQSPYVLSQLTGKYQSVPTFLDTQHPIESVADAQAYLDRLVDFGTVLDGDTAAAAKDAAAGIIAPDFILDKALEQMASLHARDADTATLVTSLTRRAAAKQLPGDWGKRAAAIYTGKIQPALERQIAQVRAMRAMAGHAAGISRLPDGAAYYAAALKIYTTSSLAPAEVHRIGLEQTTAYQAEIDQILKAQGLTKGTVGERLAHLATDPKYLYPDTDAGKADMIVQLNKLVAAITPRLPRFFHDPPHVPLEVRRVPPDIEAGAPLGYYQSATLDGSRPAIYYINLRHTADWPRWLTPSVTFHEGVPGHHLQGSVAHRIAALPLLRKVQFNSGYGEGWALYAEQLADELGMYENDPLGRVGYLKSELWRACRMVLDTGIHTMGWSREQAIRWKMENDGSLLGGASNEVERYCVWPGQAPSYKIGHTVINRLRDRARASLGSRFDIKDFHDVVLNSGAVPLDILEGMVSRYAASRPV